MLLYNPVMVVRAGLPCRIDKSRQMMVMENRW